MLFSKTGLWVLMASLLAVKTYSQVETPPDTINVNGEIFDRVEKEAAFPGGDAAWRKFLEQKLNGSISADNGAPVGQYTVIIQFVVGTDGTVSDIKPLTTLGYGMEQEVMRIIKQSGPWEPASINGRPVKAYRKQPVTFVVETDEFDIETQQPHVLFTGIDNELMVKVNNVKNKDLVLTISQGSIKPAAGDKFIARVSKPGRVIIKLFNSKKNKEIGEESFEVRESK